MFDKSLPMTGFEPQISGVGGNRSTNWATTTAQTIIFSCATNPRLFFFIKMRQSRPLFRPFHIKIHLQIKKNKYMLRLEARNSNWGRAGSRCRRIHWAMACRTTSASFKSCYRNNVGNGLRGMQTQTIRSSACQHWPPTHSIFRVRLCLFHF